MERKNILLRTNLLVCIIIVVGFLATAFLGYRANYSSSLENMEQVSNLTSEGIFYKMNTTFTKPVNISLTMANDSLLKELLGQEGERLEDPAFVETVREYLQAYREKYGYDSVFLVSADNTRYYNFLGLDRVLEPDDPENSWYYQDLLGMDDEYNMEVDNDEVEGAGNEITVFVNCKIRGEDGGVIGVVGVGLRVGYIQELLQDYQDNFDVNAYLIDDSGTIQVSTEYTGYEAVNLFEVGAYGESARQKVLSWREENAARSFWELDESGKKRNYLVTRYLPEIGWHLVVERDTRVIMEELSVQVVTSVMIICAIISGILLIITFVIRGFNRRIVVLTQSIEQERRSLFQTATEQLFENIYELDITRNRPANRATEEYFESLGIPPGTSFDRALRIIAQRQIKEEFREGYLETFDPAHVLRAYERGEESLRYEFMISQDGEHYYWMRITARLVYWETDGSLHMLVYRQNIDAEKWQEQRMQRLARTDEMTGFLTKTATQRRIGELLRTGAGGHFAYFIFDIDNFKQANDRFGHAFGDSVIREFTGIMRAHFRRDDVLGRIGGDEFAAFLPVPDRAWAEERAKTLSRELSREHTWEGMTWTMSASIGISLAPEHGKDPETLYERADAALYETKKRGKNGYTVFDGDV